MRKRIKFYFLSYTLSFCLKFYTINSIPFFFNLRIFPLFQCMPDTGPPLRVIIAVNILKAQRIPTVNESVILFYLLFQMYFTIGSRILFSWKNIYFLRTTSVLQDMFGKLF